MDKWQNRLLYCAKVSLWGWHYRYVLMQGWCQTPTLPCQKTNPDGVICGGWSAQAGRVWEDLADFIGLAYRVRGIYRWGCAEKWITRLYHYESIIAFSIPHQAYLGLYGIIRTKQPLRVGLLVGQALEQSDNPAIVRHNVQPLRVGLSKSSAYQLIVKRLSRIWPVQ